MSQNFDDYLKKESPQYRYKEIALTAKSYKNMDHELDDKDTNCELATYGDALLKLALCDILFEDGVENITTEKQDYESDEVLVKVVARHYNLLNKVRYDKNDDKIPQNYDYKKDKKDAYKYIATAVEALIASYYLDNGKNFELVLNLAEEWKKLIDYEKSLER